MTQQEMIALQYYAAHSIIKLAEHDHMLKSIADLVRAFIHYPNSKVAILHDDEAWKFVNWLPEDDDKVGRPFTEQEVKNYHKIGRELLNVATDTRSNNKHLQLVANYLYPLFSQDHRTIDMGFDLHEYMDWYFFETTREEREKKVKDLVRGWYISD